jgi:hypothetical protein
MNNDQYNFLLAMAAKYIWWKTPNEAILFENRVLAQIMNIGDFEDEMNLISLIGKDRLKETIQQAEAGWFSPQSWAFWHRILHITPLNAEVPNLPKRVFL